MNEQKWVAATFILTLILCGIGSFILSKISLNIT
jgi:hypothetical protein